MGYALYLLIVHCGRFLCTHAFTLVFIDICVLEHLDERPPDNLDVNPDTFFLKQVNILVIQRHLIIPGIIVSSLAFMAVHPYNGLGRVAIALMGLVLAFLAWYSFGLEAGSGIHVANNFAAFFFAGIGLDHIQSEVTIGSFLMTTLPAIVYVVLIVLLDRRFHLFDKIYN